MEPELDTQEEKPELHIQEEEPELDIQEEEPELGTETEPELVGHENIHHVASFHEARYMDLPSVPPSSRKCRRLVEGHAWHMTTFRVAKR